MLVMGIDASLDTLGIGLCAGDDVICESLAPRDVTLARLLPAVDDLLARAKITISDVDLFAVTVGPGWWTSLRVAVTTVKTVAHALNRPVVGVSTLEALAYHFRKTDQRVQTVVDAKRGRVHMAEYSCSGSTPELIVQPRIVPLDELSSSKDASVVRIGSFPTDYELPSNVPLLFHRIRPAFVAEAGWRTFARFGADDAMTLAPDYKGETGLRVRSRAAAVPLQTEVDV